MAIDELTGSFGAVVTWNARDNLTGDDYNPITNVGQIGKTLAYSSATAVAALGGANQFISYLISITGGSSTTVDLQALTNILNQTGVSLARIKGFMIRLLAVADDATNGTAATSITFGNTGVAVTNLHDLNGGGVGSGLTIDITHSGGALNTAAINAAGSGYPKSSVFLAALIQSSASQGIVVVTTNGSGVPTAVTIAAGGTGYSNASAIPSQVITHRHIYTGGVDLVFDRSAAGETVTSTKKNLVIQNNDASVTAKVQLTIFGADS